MHSTHTPRAMFCRLPGRVVETADIGREGWRRILLAMIGGALALLIAEALGDSDDGKAVAALLGATAGAVIHQLAMRLRWRARTFSAMAAVAAALAVPAARR